MLEHFDIQFTVLHTVYTI